MSLNKKLTPIVYILAVLNADSVIGPYDIAGAVIASLFFIWSISTVVSWIFSKADLSFCLIWRITEKLKDSKKGIRNVIMIPGLFSLTCLIISAAALIYGIYRLSYQDYSFEWYNGFVLISFSAGMLLDLALSFYILSDRFRLIYTMQEEAVARAKTSERYRIDLVTNVSHDLRTPLTSIIGYSELTVVLLSCSVFLALSGAKTERIRTKKLIAFISGISFEAYLLSYLFDSNIYPLITKAADRTLYFPVGMMMVSVVFIFSLAAAFPVNRLSRLLSGALLKKRAPAAAFSKCSRSSARPSCSRALSFPRHRSLR